MPEQPLGIELQDISEALVRVLAETGVLWDVVSYRVSGRFVVQRSSGGIAQLIRVTSSTQSADEELILGPARLEPDLREQIIRAEAEAVTLTDAEVLEAKQIITALLTLRGEGNRVPALDVPWIETDTLPSWPAALARCMRNIGYGSSPRVLTREILGWLRHAAGRDIK